MMSHILVARLVANLHVVPASLTKCVCMTLITSLLLLTKLKFLNLELLRFECLTLKQMSHHK